MSIYIIRHKFGNDCYIGSTKDFEERTKKHKESYSNENAIGYNLKIYQFVRDNGGWDNFDMVEICKCDIDKLKEMEQYHIDFIKPSLNKICVIRDKNNKYKDTKRKLYEKNREKRLEQAKEYQNNNKEKRKEWNCVCECDCGKTYTKKHKARHLKTNYHLSRCPPH